MKTIFIIICIVGLSACRLNHSDNNTDALRKHDTDSIVSIKANTDKSVTRESSVINCVGAEPDFRILDTLKYPRQKFYYNKQDRTGYTDFVTRNDDSVQIAFSNCIVSQFIFTINTSRINGKTNDTAQIANAASEILLDLKKDLSLPLDIDSAARSLNHFYSTGGVKLKQEIYFNKEESFTQYVKLDSIARNGNRTLIFVCLMSDL